jgi:hypothetical protein
MPLGEEILTGPQAARLCLLGEIDTVWSSPLYRASIVRATDAFFPGSAPCADLEACLNCLMHGDFGFVHEVLSFERIHDEMITAKLLKMNSQHLVLDRMRFTIQFGPELLSQSEQERRLDEQLSGYFDALAVDCFHFWETDRTFWRLHRERLCELGYSIYNPRLAKAILMKFLDLTLNPKTTIEKILRRAKSAGRGTRHG